MSEQPEVTASGAAIWVPLESADNPAQVGGKAANLGRCIRAGWPVPPGGVITTSAYLRLLAGELDLAALRTTVAEQLATYAPDQLFAVRSSAEVEDSATASFAGQFQSVLDVMRNDVAAAITTVQQSVRNPAAPTYAKRLGARAPDALAVIVQSQVTARLAGVCFTLDPVTGADDVLVEYTTGMGEAVVGGLALAADSCRFLRTPAGDLRPAAACGHVADAARVAEMAVSLESMFGAPQDVEWAYDALKLWLLQTRPVTAAGGARLGDI